ncbi:MAG: hypothetical protein WD928_07080 [Gammaproteobacteria bacterium]
MKRFTPLLYGLLLLLAVPWYWPADNHAIWFGVPAWVCVAVLVSLAASILTAILMTKPWPGEGDSENDDSHD